MDIIKDKKKKKKKKGGGGGGGSRILDERISNSQTDSRFTVK